MRSIFGTRRRTTPPPSEDFSELKASPLVATTGLNAEHAPDGRPFVLDPAGRLYLARYFDHQQALAAGIVRVATAAPAAFGSPSHAVVDALFPPAPDGKPDAQRAAALHAASASFTIVAGGPGTGKTSTVVKVLALLVDAARGIGAAPPRIMLVAPTGKAAARLGESIRSSLERLQLDPAVLGAIPTQATTIHRALGVRARGGFHHGMERPLEADLVVVDEASMVDLALMRAVVEALRPGTRLVLLGDRDQLASVEAGSVLADLCDAAQREGSALEGALCELTFSHRFGETSGIGRLARAIRERNTEAALAILDDASVTDATLEVPIPPTGRLPAALQSLARDGYAALRIGTHAERLRALGRFRVLSAHRRGPLGVTQLGLRIAASIGRSTDAHAIGTPILVLENDAETGLSNGDVGVIAESATTTDASAFANLALFDSDAGTRELAVARLPAHEPCWAMSIHKSQGSEFDVVSVVIPEGSALATRELLYTAVTRARERVAVHASRATLASCIERRAVRASGLADAIIALGLAAHGGVTGT